MADVNKIKLQLLSGGVSVNGDKTPSPATKLLLNHGKPNFTIQRTGRSQNGNVRVTVPTAVATNNHQHNNNESAFKSNTLNGTFKPSNISVAPKQALLHNGNNTITNNGNDDIEAAKVVLRRAKVVPTDVREGDVDDENVPEFIRRQRRIQERLANQNILDFENRRSGYFTQVLITPSTPNRQSFMETMASPAVKPGLEMPSTQTHHEDIQEETIPSEEDHEKNQSEFEKSREAIIPNGQVEEEEVAKAIEEVNKAVEGEDDDKTELDQVQFFQQATDQNIQSTVAEETKPEENEKQQQQAEAEEIPTVAEVKLISPENIHNDVKAYAAPLIEAKIEESDSNSLIEEEHLENGSIKAEKLGNGITISHVNALSGPCIPPPDPKGEKGINFETKTVVSFYQELGNGNNKYPDTVKLVKDVSTLEGDNSELKELSKLKFEINADNNDIEVKPVLKTESA